MRHIYLLDCTLRDGGYVNNWEFGKECIQKFPIELCEANIDILELGFIRNEAVNHDRTVFTSADDLGRFKHILSARPEGMAYGVPSGYIQRVHRMPHLSDGQLRDNFNYQNVIYSAMIEGNEKEKTFPVHKLGTPQETGIALIRICTWKRLMEEHLEYCRSVSDLGYQVSIQPTAIDQYDDETFIKLLKLTNHVMPFSFYLVDTWGTQSPRQIVHYAQLVNEYLDPTIKLGYHGHNNKMQAISCVDALLSLSYDRDICIDSSVMGMGRGPGNLQTEVIMDYLNHYFGKNYQIKTVVNLYSKYIKKFFDASPWGYSMYHFISSEKALPQDFATYFKEKNYSLEEFYSFVETLNADERVVFKKSFVENRLKEMDIYRD